VRARAAAVLLAFAGASTVGAYVPAGSAPALPPRVWKPPPSAVAAAAAASFPYVGAPTWQGASGCSSGLTAHARAVAAAIRARYGAVPIGGYACRPNTADTSQTSVHGTGRALDVMTTAGAPIADWLLANAATLGVQLIIWDRRIWRVGRGVGPYGGPNPHTDHVHVEVTGAGTTGIPTELKRVHLEE
jgi:hypothetical protein